ncbi:tetratricopeptide repeat protein [Sorangium sp. So ce448]|uniref:tetratricopeptide repeat protein n=1 Tax=Sorangium sp. So ce448 TaxID=3133314 RepID=UPI003F5EE1C8
MAERVDPLTKTLRSDEGVLRLAHGLALSERFHFYLLVCETPRVASAALDVLAVEVAAAREEPVRLVRIDPHSAHAALDRPIPFDLLAEQVLARLVSPAPDERAPGVIFVVDASRALTQDDEGWSQLFQRLNEQRNGIAKALAGPLVLVVPGRLEAAFAHGAPDFWSIRSLAVVVDAPPGVKPEAVEPAEERRERLVEPAPERAWSAAEIEAEVAAARVRLAEAPEDESALSSLIVWLGRQVQHEMDRGTLDRALRAAEESLLLERRQAEKHPGRVEWLHDLSLSLDNAGDVYRARGDLERALTAYDESLSLRRRLLALDPARPEWLRNVAVSLDNVGDVHSALGDLERAIMAYDESLSVVRRLLALDSARPEWLRDLSVSLDNVGHVHRSRGNLERALAAYDESLSLRRRLLALDSARPEWLRDLSSSLNNIGNVHRSRGDLERALTAYDESLSVVRRLLALDSARPEWLRDLSVIFDNVGDVHRSRGDLERALTAYDESLSLRRRLLALDPARPEWRHDLAASLSQHAITAEAAGRPADALSFWRAALDELDDLTRRPAPLEAWNTAAATCRAEISRLEESLQPHDARRSDPPPA